MANSGIKSVSMRTSIDQVGGSTTEAIAYAKQNPGKVVTLTRYDGTTGVVNLVVSYVYLDTPTGMVLNTITPTVTIT